MQHYKKPSPSDRFNTADYDDIKSVQMASNHPTDMQNIGSCSKANTGNLENRLSESRIGMLTESYKQWTSQHEMEDMETSVGVGAPKSSNGEIKLQRVPSQEQMEFGLQFLCECFPDFRKSFLKDWLKRYNGDIVKTSDYLSRFSQLDLPDNVSESSDVVVVQDEDYDMDDDVVEQREIIDLSTPPREPKEPMGKLYFCDDDEQMKIAIDKRLGMELMKNFADESKEIGDLDEEDYLVEIDEEFKRLLFNKWMSSLKARKRRMQTFLEDDEAYARRLQNEEENQMKGRKKKRKTKQLNVPTNFSKEQPAQLFSTNAWEKDEQKQDTSSPQKVKDASGHVLTKKQLKIRELFYELFPGVDEHALNDVLEANSYNLEAATNIVKSSCGVATTALRKNKSKQKVQVPGCSKDVTIVTERTGEVGRFQSMSEDNQDYGNIRAEAELHKQQRIEFYQKAAIAFEKKQGQLAQYYADMGNQHTQKMKEAHARAAELILQRKNKAYMKDQQIIDLHGLHPNEAVLAVKNFIRNAYNIKHSWVDIITGRGLNSKTRGKSTVRNAVVSYLDQARFRYEEKSSGGMLRVSLLR